MDVLTLRLFLDAAKSLNFTKAADDFYTTQPAVSRRINELENELGFKLFVRKNHGVSLTKEGELFLPFVQKSIDALDLGITTLNNIASVSKRTITIVSMTPMISTFLPAIIRKYTEKNPDIEFEVIRMFSKQIRKSISEGGKNDIYIGEESDISVDASWNKTIIKSDALGLIVRECECLDSQAKVKKFIRTHHAFLLPMDDAPALIGLSRKILTAYGSSPASWIETSPIESIMFNISSGIGFSLLPKNDLLLKAFDLKLIALETDEQINMAIAHKANASTHVKAFADLVIRHVANSR